jgi:hypothetical protein
MKKCLFWVKHVRNLTKSKNLNRKICQIFDYDQLKSPVKPIQQYFLLSEINNFLTYFLYLNS